MLYSHVLCSSQLSAVAELPSEGPSLITRCCLHSKQPRKVIGNTNRQYPRAETYSLYLAAAVAALPSLMPARVRF